MYCTHVVCSVLCSAFYCYKISTTSIPFSHLTDSLSRSCFPLTHLVLKLFDRTSCTYTYLLGDSSSSRALLIDPVLEFVQRDLSLVNELGLKVSEQHAFFISPVNSASSFSLILNYFFLEVARTGECENQHYLHSLTFYRYLVVSLDLTVGCVRV